jgi:hypothetical protein
MLRRSATKKQDLAKVESIEPVICEIRGQRVILDADLARIYRVTTKALNQGGQAKHFQVPVGFHF